MKSFTKSLVFLCLFSLSISSANAGVGVVRKARVDEIKVTEEKGKFGETEFLYHLTVSREAEQYDECLLEGVVNSLNFKLVPVIAEQSVSRKDHTVQLKLAPKMIDNGDGTGEPVMKLDPALITRIVRAKGDETLKPAFDVHLAKNKAAPTKEERKQIAEAMKFLVSQRFNEIGSERIEMAIIAKNDVWRCTFTIGPKKPAPKFLPVDSSVLVHNN